MINNVSLNYNINSTKSGSIYANSPSFGCLSKLFKKKNKNKNVDNNPQTNPITAQQVLAQQINTTLSPTDQEKYNQLIQYLQDMPISENAEGLTPNQQLSKLLANGKLLAKSETDGSTTLDNIYNIMAKKRVDGITPKNLISNTLDILVNPRIVSQVFGDIPQSEKNKILQSLPKNDEVKKDPSLMDLDPKTDCTNPNKKYSGTCPAASNEVNMADKYPAEFVRWVEGLSGEQKAVYVDVKMSSLNKNPLESISFLNIFNPKIIKYDMPSNKVKIKITTDDNAYIRAKIQDKYWDKGERNVADVLVQSAIMQLGSHGTYNSLTDIKYTNSKLPDSPAPETPQQGLWEAEKTFVESVIKNMEITSVPYQIVDANQNLVGYTCSLDKMQEHIVNAIDSGNNVIIGYTLTNETSGKTKSPDYNPENDGAPEKIINGHEITIVGYEQDKDGKLAFICIDTDDNNDDYVRYSAEYLLPKIHHAGFPAKMVEKDIEEMIQNYAA